jgi:nucleoside-diphosphate-sugar epimerase
MKTILITGGTGFIGHHLLSDIESGKYNIKVLTRNSKLKSLPSFCSVIEGDLLNQDSLIEAGRGVDILINMAAEVRNMAVIRDTNINGTKNLISSVQKNKIKKVIHLSSVGVVGAQYAVNHLSVNENSLSNPKNEYESSKLISEQLFLEAAKDGNFELDILRPTNVFGEKHPFNALLSLFKHTISGMPLLLGKNSLVNYVYVKNLTYLILYFIESESQKGIINVGKTVSLVDFYTNIKKIVGSKNKLIVLPEIIPDLLFKLGINKIQNVTNQISYSDNKLNSFFQYPFSDIDGLKITIDYYRKLNLLK